MVHVPSDLLSFSNVLDGQVHIMLRESVRCHIPYRYLLPTRCGEVWPTVSTGAIRGAPLTLRNMSLSLARPETSTRSSALAKSQLILLWPEIIFRCSNVPRYA